MKNNTLFLLLCTSQLVQSKDLENILPTPHSPSVIQSIIASKKPQISKTTYWPLVEYLAGIPQFFNPKHLPKAVSFSCPYLPKTASFSCPFDIQGEHTQCMSPFFHHPKKTYLTDAARSGDSNPFIEIFDSPPRTFSQEQNAEIMHALFILATSRQQAEEYKEKAREAHFTRMFSDVSERFLPLMLQNSAVSSRDFKYALVSMLPLVTKRQQNFLELLIETKNPKENPKTPRYLDDEDDDELTIALEKSLKEQ